MIPRLSFGCSLMNSADRLKYGVAFRPKTLEYRLKTRFTKLRRWIIHLNAERHNPLQIPLSEKIRAWRLGFTSLSYRLYDLNRNNPKHYLRDFADMNYLMDTPGGRLLGDKLYVATMMKQLGIESPRVLAVLHQGRVHDPLGGRILDGLPQWISSCLAKHSPVVFKPIYGGAGKGFFFAQKEDRGYSLNDVEVSFEELCRILSNCNTYFASEFIRQAQYAHAIYPHTTNTVRILTILNDDDGEPYIAAAAQRIGTKHSFPLDNFHGGLGGLSANIDIDSGKLSSGILLSASGRLSRCARHPETNGRIKGLQIPHWERIKKEVSKAARHFVLAPYVGWDLVVTPEGCSILEGNCPMGTVVWQVHTPLLRDSRMKAFYRNHGMLPG